MGGGGIVALTGLGIALRRIGTIGDGAVTVPFAIGTQDARAEVLSAIGLPHDDTLAGSGALHSDFDGCTVFARRTRVAGGTTGEAITRLIGANTAFAAGTAFAAFAACATFATGSAFAPGTAFATGTGSTAPITVDLTAGEEEADQSRRHANSKPFFHLYRLCESLDGIRGPSLPVLRDGDHGKAYVEKSRKHRQTGGGAADQGVRRFEDLGPAG